MRAGYVPPGELANLSGGTLVTEPKGIEPMTDPGMIHAQDQRSSPDRRAAGESDVPVEEGGHGREVVGHKINGDGGDADARHEYPAPSRWIALHIPQRPGRHAAGGTVQQDAQA